MSINILKQHEIWYFEFARKRPSKPTECNRIGIARAWAYLGYQLVLSLGGADIDLGELPGSPIVLPYAPQLKMLQKADLFISHCGMNGTLEALRNGVPIVGIPIANDQFSPWEFLSLVRAFSQRSVMIDPSPIKSAMPSPTLLQLETTISTLSATEKLWLLEHIAQLLQEEIGTPEAANNELLQEPSTEPHQTATTTLREILAEGHKRREQLPKNINWLDSTALIREDRER